MYRLNPNLVSKFSVPIRKLSTFIPNIIVENNRLIYNYQIESREIFQQILPSGFEKTKVWGFGGYCYDAISNQITYQISSPGPSFSVRRNIHARITWINNLKLPYMFPVDPSLLWANPKDIQPREYYKAQAPVPMVVHIHGAQVPPIYDGHPDAWFTANNLRGPMYITNTYEIQNRQESATLWYHDNTRGLSRLNVYSGLVGAYMITDSRHLISDKLQDVTLIIQDKAFNEDASLYYHPYWVSSFLGDVILVNGVSWPFMDVERALYRFRVINASNSRRYHLYFSDNHKFTQIATDGGYIEYSRTLDHFGLSPGERVELIMDFRDYYPGASILLKNNEVNAQEGTTDSIMQFRIINTEKGIEVPALGMNLNYIKKLVPDISGILTTVNEIKNGNNGVFIDGQPSNNPVTNINQIGATSIWDFVNLTNIDESIHLHLIQFQVMSRQAIDTSDYLALWKEINGDLPLDKPTKYLDVTSFLTGDSIVPEDYEHGWKDTVHLPMGSVTRIIVRYAPTYINDVKPGENTFPFNPTEGGEYSFNSTILEHNDNDASRPQFIIY